MGDVAPVGCDGPFGGFKAGGIGRATGVFGLSEFVEYPTVSL